MTRTVTEGAYNRVIMFAMAEMNLSLILIAIAAIANETDISIILGLAATVFVSMAHAIAWDGWNRKIWGRWLSINWSIDDIDVEDFANGPVEVDT